MPQTVPTRHEIYNNVTKDPIDYAKLESSFGNGEIPLNKRTDTTHVNGTKTTTFDQYETFGHGPITEGEEDISIISLNETPITFKDGRNALRFEKTFNNKHPGGIVLNKDKKSAIGFVPYTVRTLREKLEKTELPTREYENVLVKKHSVYIKEHGEKDAQDYTKAENTLYDYECNQLEHSRKVLVGKNDTQGNLVEPSEQDCRQKLNESIKTILSVFNGENSEVTVFRDVENQGKEYIKEGCEVRISNKDGKREIQITAKEFAHEQPARKVTIELQQTPDGKIAADVSKIIVEVDGKSFDVAEGDYAFFSQFFKPQKQATSYEERKKQIDSNPDVMREREKSQNRLNEILTNGVEVTISDVDLLRGAVYKNLQEVDAVKNPELYQAYDSVLKIYNAALLNRSTAVESITDNAILEHYYDEIIRLKSQNIKEETQKNIQIIEQKRNDNIIPFFTVHMVAPSVIGEKGADRDSVVSLSNLENIPNIPYKEEYTDQEVTRIANLLFKSADSYLLKTEKGSHQNLSEAKRQKLVMEFTDVYVLRVGIRDLELTIERSGDEALKAKLRRELKLKQKLIARFQTPVTQ